MLVLFWTRDKIGPGTSFWQLQLVPLNKMVLAARGCPLTSNSERLFSEG